MRILCSICVILFRNIYYPFGPSLSVVGRTFSPYIHCCFVFHCGLLDFHSSEHFSAFDILPSKPFWMYMLHNWCNKKCFRLRLQTLLVTAAGIGPSAEEVIAFKLQAKQLQFGSQVSGTRRWVMQGKCVGGFAEGTRLTAVVRTSGRGMLYATTCVARAV